jgi:hypothetical protein
MGLDTTQFADLTNGEVALGRNGREGGLHAGKLVTFSTERRGYTKSTAKVRVSEKYFSKLHTSGSRQAGFTH